MLKKFEIEIRDKYQLSQRPNPKLNRIWKDSINIKILNNNLSKLQMLENVQYENEKRNSKLESKNAKRSTENKILENLNFK
jgi:hypothetical protein